MIGYTKVRIDTTPDKDGWCFCTPFNHPEDIERFGHTKFNEEYQIFTQIEIDDPMKTTLFRPKNSTIFKMFDDSYLDLADVVYVSEVRFACETVALVFFEVHTRSIEQPLIYKSNVTRTYDRFGSADLLHMERENYTLRERLPLIEYESVEWMKVHRQPFIDALIEANSL